VQSAEIRLGTRGSPLALAQAEEVRRALVAAGVLPAAAIAIVPIRTTGDRIGERPIAEAGGKGLFTRELDEALRDGRIDAAVHSAKDMETRLAEGTVIAACLRRGDPRDAFIATAAERLGDLAPGATVGTSSLRRTALTLRARPDLKVVSLRGNIGTRIARLDDGGADAILLGAAGLARLGLTSRITSLIDPDAWPPAAGQGTIAIAARTGDARNSAMLAAIGDRETGTALAAERAFLAALDGSCRTPIGALARVEAGRLRFAGIVIKPDGSAAHEVAREGGADEAEAIGAAAGADLARRAGPGFFDGG
jgi:hydroxymethylbilane synthase